MCDDWSPTEIGVFGERLREAADHPIVQRAAITLFSTAGGATASYDFEAAAAAAVAHTRPDWLRHVSYADGSLADGTSLRLAADFDYYAEKRALADQTAAGSPFDNFVGAVWEAARASAVDGGAAVASIDGKAAATRAALLVRYARESAWPPLLQVYAKPGVPRELDFMDRVAYHKCGGEGTAAQAVVVARLARVLAAASKPGSSLGVLAWAHQGYLNLGSLVSEQRRLQEALSLRSPEVVVLRTLEETSRRLGEWRDLVASVEMQGLAHTARITKLVLVVGGGTPLAAHGLSVARTVAADADDGSSKGIANRLHPGKLAVTRASVAFLDTVRDARAFHEAEQPGRALRVLLGGRQGSPPSVVGGKSVPGKAVHAPLTLAHMMLV